MDFAAEEQAGGDVGDELVPVVAPAGAVGVADFPAVVAGEGRGAVVGIVLAGVPGAGDG